MPRSLPANPSLDQYRNQARELLNAARTGDPDALQRLREHHPRFSQAPQVPLDPASLRLNDAQWVIAREHGARSWPRFKRQVEATALAQAFEQAVRSGDPAALRSLAAREPAVRSLVNEPLFDFDAPAILAAAGGSDPELIDALLEMGADINIKSRWWAGGFGALHNVEPERAAYLIQRGAEVDAHAAARLDMLERLQDLVRRNPGVVNERGGDGMTPLHFAATPRIAAYLLDHGAEIDLRDLDHGSTPAQYALKDRPDVCRLLLKHGAEPDIFMACVLGDADLTRRVLAADPGCLSARIGEGRFTSGESQGGHIYIYTLGYTARPLPLAASLGHQEVVNLLLPHATLKERFLSACAAGDEAAVHAVLAEQPEIARTLPPEEMRLISDAAWNNQIAAVRLMLDAGFDIDARGVHDSTPLDRAAIRGYHALVELLLARGASLDVMNEFGGTPLRACIWGSVNFRDPTGDYPACAESLLAAGAALPDSIWGSAEVQAVLRRHMDW